MIKSAWPGEVGKKPFWILISTEMCNILSLKTWANLLQINQALTFLLYWYQVYLYQYWLYLDCHENKKQKKTYIHSIDWSSTNNGILLQMILR